VVVRPAVLDDAEVGARCQLACWEEAYGDIADPARLAVQLADLEGRVASWRSQLSAGRAPWVAVADGRLVGFGSAGPPPPTEPDPPLMLYALYVRGAWWGSDLGHRLLTAAIGDAAASLWVFRDNDRPAASTPETASAPTAPSATRPTSATSRSGWSAPDRRPTEGLQERAVRVLTAPHRRQVLQPVGDPGQLSAGPAQRGGAHAGWSVPQHLRRPSRGCGRAPTGSAFCRARTLRRPPSSWTCCSAGTAAVGPLRGSCQSCCPPRRS
jgi:GNAT superfamily N-acetyltransferase